MSFITKKFKAIVSTILAFLISAAGWGIAQWTDYNVFKKTTIDDVSELKIIAKETNETLKKVEISIARIEIAIKHKN